MNALRYFDQKHYAQLGKEFLQELRTYGRIYMHRFRPNQTIEARTIHASIQPIHYMLQELCSAIG